MHAQAVTPTPVRLPPESVLTGFCRISLTRALVPYRDPVRAPPGGAIEDIGLGVVMEGSDPSRAQLLDLGSAEIRAADLSGPLIVLGWLPPAGLRGLEAIVERGSADDRVRGSTFSLALRSLREAGFGPLTRSVILRIGFRDLCQDLDLHEGTAVRLARASHGVARMHLEYDTATLVLRTGRAAPDPQLEAALSEAFPGREVRRCDDPDPLAALGYRLPFPIPGSLEEARGLLSVWRTGLGRLLARFEPDRYRTVQEYTAAFGPRDSLRSIEDPAGVSGQETIEPDRDSSPPWGGRVH